MLSYSEYEVLHTEIFNSEEQRRLSEELQAVSSLIESSDETKIALDYGCGTGNLTGHLLRLGFQVVAADVSRKYLKVIHEKYGREGKVTVNKINGKDLDSFPDNYFHIVGAYSVLHHVKDYLFITKEFSRVTKQGGIIYIDHEMSDDYWKGNKEYSEFLERVKVRKRTDWKEYLRVSNCINSLRVRWNPMWKLEGDIHVWPHDHIEWGDIEKVLIDTGCEPVRNSEYLLYRAEYPMTIYQQYKGKCHDVRMMAFQKRDRRDRVV